MDPSPNAASVAILRGGEVLLIRRAFEPWANAWTLPGGRREAGETAEQCAIREVREELGLGVTALRPVTVLTFGPSSPYRLAVFATDRFDGMIRPSDEIGAWRWTEPQAVGGLVTTPDLDRVLASAFGLFGSGERGSALAEIHAQEPN